MRNVLIAAAAALFATSAGAVTVVNASFEDGIAIGGVGFETLATGDTTSLPGWTVLSEGIDYIGPFWSASDGSRSLDLSALTSGGISQMISDFEVGKRYRMTFDISANPSGGNDNKRIVVSVTGGIAEILTYQRTAANTASNMLWTSVSYEFTAFGPIQMVQFRSLETDPSGVALDNVTISLIPEPAAWTMLVAGFGMTGLALRRRKLLRGVIA